MTRTANPKSEQVGSGSWHVIVSGGAGDVQSVSLLTQLQSPSKLAARKCAGLPIPSLRRANWPVLGLLCRSMGTIFVDRNSRLDVLRVNRLIEQALRSGKGVLLFPEGTSTPGSEVLPFHSALLEPAVQEGCPVSFATVSYRTPVGQAPAHLSVCWWGEMSFLPHFYRFLQLKSVEATLVFGSHSIRADDRKLLARKLWQAVKDEFIPVVETEELCKTPTH